MSELTIKRSPETGTALLTISGLEGTEPRIRLRDRTTGKYLTRRGWSKTAAHLPVTPIREGDDLTFALDADLARRIAAGTELAVDEPVSGFVALAIWPDAPAATSDNALPGDEPPLSLEPSIRDEAIIAPEPLAADQADADDDVAAPVAPLLPESRTARSPLPLALSAAIFFLLGGGITYALLGTGKSAAIDTAVNAASASFVAEKVKLTETVEDLRKKLEKKTSEASAAQQTSSADKSRIETLEAELAETRASLDSVKASGESQAKARLAELEARISTLTQKSQADSEALKAREAELADAKASLAEAVSEAERQKTAAATDAAARRTEFDGKAKLANEQLAAANKTLAERDQQLRDVQAKLSVANVQLEALQTLAAKSSEADLERVALDEKLKKQSAEMDKAKADLAEKQQALTDANIALAAARENLADATAQLKEQIATAGDQQPPAEPGDMRLANLQQERDMFAKELKDMTDKFRTLLAEKNTLEKKLAAASGPVGEDKPTATITGIWGATAIDSEGTIYALQNQTSEKAARDNVAAICRGKSNSRCEPLAAFSNACFSLARFTGEGPANDNFGYVVHKDAKKSAAGAIAQCKSLGYACDLRLTTCSPDTLGGPAAE